MEDRLKGILWRLARFLLVRMAPRETYRVMRSRHVAEIEIFQKHCTHREVTKYWPLVTCLICDKVLRYVTDEDRAAVKGSRYLSAIKEAKKIEKQRV